MAIIRGLSTLTPDRLMRRLLTALFGTALALAMAPAHAAGNPENGKTLSYTCAGCHGIPEYRNAYPSYHVPKIAGQNEAYLVNALKAYKSGDRQHPTMTAQASSFSDQDIADIAAYLSAPKAK
jgi:cytochrome c553